jgi:hypothetical protein
MLSLEAREERTILETSYSVYGLLARGGRDVEARNASPLTGNRGLM